MSEPLLALTMPKWGLAMTEGLVAAWHIAEGHAFAAGDELLDIETTKITNAFEAPLAGTLRRRVVAAGETVPVGALLAVIADAARPEAEIDAFIADFAANFDAASAAAAETEGPEPAWIEAGGRRLRYLSMGAADGGRAPLVLVHGFGGDLNTWMFNQPALAEAGPVHALDLPGHGGSVKQVGAGDVAELAGAVIAFLDAVGIDRAHFAGHSLGGAMALLLALDRADRVASASLICPAGLGRELNIDFIEGFIGATRRKHLKPVLEQLFADPALVSREIIDEVLKYKRLDGAVAALRTIADAAFAHGVQQLVLAERCAELAVPVQVIWGAEDRIVPAAHADGLPARIEVHRLAGAGHMPHMELAGEVNQLIAAFTAA